MHYTHALQTQSPSRTPKVRGICVSFRMPPVLNCDHTIATKQCCEGPPRVVNQPFKRTVNNPLKEESRWYWAKTNLKVKEIINILSICWKFECCIIRYWLCYKQYWSYYNIFAIIYNVDCIMTNWLYVQISSVLLNIDYIVKYNLKPLKVMKSHLKQLNMIKHHELIYTYI